MRALWWLLGTVAAAIPKIPKQVVQYGRFRTASTLQYQSLCAIMHLVHGADGAVACHHLARVDARGVPLTAPGAARGDRHTYRPQPLPRLAAGESRRLQNALPLRRAERPRRLGLRDDERHGRHGPAGGPGYDVKLVQSAELFDSGAWRRLRRSSASATARCASSTTTRATGIFCASAAAPRCRGRVPAASVASRRPRRRASTALRGLRDLRPRRRRAALLNTHIFRTYGRRSRVLRSLSVADGDLNGTYCAASAAHMATRGYLPSRKRLVGFLTDAQAPEAGLYRPRRGDGAPPAGEPPPGEARGARARGCSFAWRARRTGQSSFMGLGDLVAYTFVGLIVAVFIFQLVDTAQTAKRKLVAKKND
ncbi:hypothetical protein JL721_6255 [Aureococcus anophagefferens]|nr:hypothetical protein JL721_6255 [Aureococcus anophagefferens]